MSKITKTLPVSTRAEISLSRAYEFDAVPGSEHFTKRELWQGSVHSPLLVGPYAPYFNYTVEASTKEEAYSKMLDILMKHLD